MSGANGTSNSIKGTSTLVRPRFGPGMLLQHEDLEQLTAYTRELSRLLFRSFFGCGVVCGLKVDFQRVCGKAGIVISSGLALDCAGDPVYVPGNPTLALDDGCHPDLVGPLYVLLCGTTTCCAPRPPACPSDEDEAPAVCTRERDGYEIRIVKEKDLPPCRCSCLPGSEGKLVDDCQCADPSDPCYQRHYNGECGCDAGTDCHDCCCDCIVLARLDKKQGSDDWTPDHSVRRFVRPVLMRDPRIPKPQDPVTPPPPPPPTPAPDSGPAAADESAPEATKPSKGGKSKTTT